MPRHAAGGRFSLSDAELDDVFIGKLRGTFQVTAQEALVERLLLFIGRDERVQGKLRLDLQCQELSAELWGRLSPLSVAQVLGRHGSELPPWLKDLPMSVPRHAAAVAVARGGYVQKCSAMAPRRGAAACPAWSIYTGAG